VAKSNLLAEPILNQRDYVLFSNITICGLMTLKYMTLEKLVAIIGKCNQGKAYENRDVAANII